MGSQLDLDDVAATSDLAMQELRELRAELESARVDAERYRWIKSHSITDRGFCDWKLPDIEYQKDFDAAIDSARGGK